MSFSFYTNLFNFDKAVVTGFILACLSSGTSYVLVPFLTTKELGGSNERRNRNDKVGNTASSSVL